MSQQTSTNTVGGNNNCNPTVRRGRGRDQASIGEKLKD